MLFMLTLAVHTAMEHQDCQGRFSWLFAQRGSPNLIMFMPLTGFGHFPFGDLFFYMDVIV
jgi:hypothetical protein